MTINFADLNTATKSEGVVFDLELLHPQTEEPTGLFVKLVSNQTEEYRRTQVELTNDVLKRSFEAQRKGKGAKPPTVDEGERRTVKLLVTATVGWYELQRSDKPGVADKMIEGLPFGDERLMFSKDEAERIFGNPGYEWVRNQVDAAVGDLANFMKG